jgi:hypothetical protein
MTTGWGEFGPVARTWALAVRLILFRLAWPLLGVLGSSALHAAEPTLVRVPPFDAPRDGRPGYFFEVLDLALRKTAASHGPYRVIVQQEVMSLERALTYLRDGKSLDVVFTAPNPGMTDDLRPIPISLLKELNNYRVLMIREGEQVRFDSVETLADLRKLTAGLGLQWVDTKIMRHNGFTVEGAALHDNLFRMLSARRFDFFPRGIYEFQSDFRQYQDLGLALEKNLFLYYEAPFYFFVNKANGKLANRIESGLKLALADGSFDRLLMSYPEFKAAMTLQRSAQRKVLRLKPLPAGCWSATTQPGLRC